MLALRLRRAKLASANPIDGATQLSEGKQGLRGKKV
jgi:hypothetical protein